ncbi:MAG: PspC domain-containing protein [Actinomycetota bacterium]|nr:PspC domain-containing protein [Actinomycetota bacterium]
MTTTPASTPTPALDRFFTALRRSPVTRSQDRVIAGVSGGIAERLGVSRPIVRLGLVVLAILTLGVPLYLLAWLMLPDSQGQVRLERAIRGGEASSIVLLVVTALSVVPDVFGRDAGLHHAGPWPFIAIAAVVVIGFKRGWWQRGTGGWNRPAHTQPTESTPTTGTGGPQDSPRD